MSIDKQQRRWTIGMKIYPKEKMCQVRLWSHHLTLICNNQSLRTRTHSIIYSNQHMRNINIAVAIDTASSTTTYISTTIHHSISPWKEYKIARESKMVSLANHSRSGRGGWPTWRRRRRRLRQITARERWMKSQRRHMRRQWVEIWSRTEMTSRDGLLISSPIRTRSGRRQRWIMKYRATISPNSNPQCAGVWRITYGSIFMLQ